MAQVLDIKKVTVGSTSFTAAVDVVEGAPLMTSENVEATARIYWLMPSIAEQVCLGDASEKFQDVMGDTELPHLMEHVAVELLVRTGMAGDITCGRTRHVSERTFEVEFACPDDVLVAAALSSAVFIVEWAFSGADPELAPNVDAIVEGIAQLTSASFGMEGDEAVPAAEPGLPSEAEWQEAAVEAEQPVEADEVEVDEPEAAPEPPVDAQEAEVVVDEGPSLDDSMAFVPPTRRM